MGVWGVVVFFLKWVLWCFIGFYGFLWCFLWVFIGFSSIAQSFCTGLGGVRWGWMGGWEGMEETESQREFFLLKKMFGRVGGGGVVSLFVCLVGYFIVFCRFQTFIFLGGGRFFSAKIGF